MVTLHKVNLTEEDRSKLHDLLKMEEHPARTIARGSVLLLASQVKNDDESAQILEIGRATVQRIRKRFCQKGLEPAPTSLPRSGACNADTKAQLRRDPDTLTFARTLVTRGEACEIPIGRAGSLSTTETLSDTLSHCWVCNSPIY